MKRIIIVICLVCCFSLNVQGQEYTTEEFLNEQASLSGAKDLEEALPDDIKGYLDEKNIDPTKKDWIGNLSVGNIIKEILETVKSRFKTPLSCMSLILAVVLISSAIQSVSEGVSAQTLGFAVTAVSAVIVTSPLLSVINSSVEVMKSVAVFMTAFIPVFGVLLATGGHAVTSGSMSGLLLGATQGVELIANHLVVPLMCGYLSVSVASSVSPLLAKTSIASSIKKLSFWIMSFVTTVFLGILSTQTTINASADSITIKTAKFVIGSSVPLAGTVLSEALSTVTASLGILKTTVGIYGVIACLVILLPLLLELLLWRISINITAVACEVLSAQLIGKLLKSIDNALSVLCGIILLTGALFVISLSILVTVGRV